MELIKQGNLYWEGGCAIACVAMLAGVSFNDSGRVFYPDWMPGNTLKAVSNRRTIKAMRSFGLRIKQVFVNDTMRSCFKMPKNPALFTCDFNDYPDRVHCVVWDPSINKMLDPAGWNSDPLDSYTKYTTDYIEVLGKRKR